MISLLGLAACGDDDADEGGTTPSLDVETTSTIAAETNEPILITTHLAPPNAQGKSVRASSRRCRSGAVPPGSTLGDARAQRSGAPWAGVHPLPGLHIRRGQWLATGCNLLLVSA